MLKLAIIADDMTGLNAVASEFQRYGLRVRTIANIEDLPKGGMQGCDVVGVDTNSRTMSADAAHAAVLLATRTLVELSPQIIMKQTDSSLHGNVAVELRAALTAASADQLIFAPACPSLGRLTQGGVHVVRDGQGHGQDVTTLLAGENGISVALAATGANLQATENMRRILICDAATDSDLDQIVSETLSTGSYLFGGSVGLAKALARHLWAQETRARLPAFLVMGSHQARTRKQCEVLLQTGTSELIQLPEDDSDLPASAAKVVGALQAGRHAVLTTSFATQNDLGGTGYPFLDEVTRARIETVTRHVIRGVMAQCRNQMSGIVVAGGATTAIVTRDVLAVTSFEDLSYLDDGVAAGLGLTKEGGAIPFVTKAGNWGGDDVLLRAILWLQTTGTRNSKLERHSHD